MASPTAQAPTSSTTRIIRKPGANADVSITSAGIERNEIREVTMVWPDGSTLPVPKDIFNPAKYDIVGHLLRIMDTTTRPDFLSKKWFEIVVEESSLNSSVSGVRVLDKLSLLSPIFHQIQKLIVRIVIPAGVVIQKTEYKTSSARTFLLELVRELRAFDSLKQMYVVLELPEGSDNTDKRHLAAYVLPFYHLDTFTHWKLQHQEFGQYPCFASNACIRHIDKTYEEFVQEERKELEKEKRQKVEDNNHMIIRPSANPIPLEFPRKIFKQPETIKPSDTHKSTKGSTSR
ncbi:uncharacterized protein PAC_07231 [Phialocephala subalpina]|uniref:Uncharacterized protein n=1 Tax=Phialocephala subalpina TaxID=576137 RepID=A0A1L7WX30_9HELO|nr:uncharacterized protein PAC_07231 [Phialocephala subalpina]